MVEGHVGAWLPICPSTTAWSPSPFRGGFKDIRRPLISAEQIGPLTRPHKRLQSLHPREKADKIILPAKREHGIDQIVPDTCFALLDFQAVG